MLWGKLIRGWRKRRGWTQYDLAAEMQLLQGEDSRGIDRSTIARWELGKVCPSPEMLDLLSGALALTAEEARQLRMAAKESRGEEYVLVGGGVPFQVPRDNPHFVGRRQELALLKATLGTGQVAAICGITGLGGIGKSALAAHFAYRQRATFADGVLYASLRESDPLTILAAFASAYGWDVSAYADLPSRAAAVRSMLANKRILVVLDNAEEVTGVRGVLSGCGEGCSVLLTTRDVELAAAVATRTIVRLPVLAEEECLALLKALASKEEVDSQKDTAREICALLGYLPLAVEIAGRLVQAHGWGLGRLRARLRDERERLKALHLKDLAVRASFELSYALLEAEEANLFATVGVFGGLSFAASAASAIAGMDSLERLDALCRRSLLWQEKSGRYRQHLLLADFAREQLQKQGREADGQQEHTRYYLDLAEKANQLLQQAEGMIGARGTFDEELGQIRLGRKWARARGDEAVVVGYALALGSYFALTGLYQDAVEWSTGGVNIVRRRGQRREECTLLSNLGEAYYYLGKALESKANCEQALEIARKIGDQSREVTLLSHIGSSYRRLGEFARANEYHYQALGLAQQLENRRVESVALGNLGMTCFHLLISA